MSKKKAKIVIASVLKPVDDVRNYEKIGCTLQKSGRYQVIMIGSKSDNMPDNNEIEFQSWKEFKRLSLGRLFIQFAFVKALFKTRPSVVIITTHELLIASLVYKALSPCKLVYDVQEDYFQNLWYQHFYPRMIRVPLAVVIRSSEWISRPFISHYLLAEATYLIDISFIKGKATTLDNKSLPISNHPSSESFNVIFTGTLTGYSKVIESIKLYSRIKSQFSNPRMIVIGHCPSKSYYSQLEILASQDQSISLLIQDHPVPHDEIVSVIAKANLAIIGYESNPINALKIPTKQYEYTVAKLPYLVRENTYWSQLGETWGGSISINFDSPESVDIPKKLEEMDKNQIKSDVASWSRNENMLAQTIDDLLTE